MSNDYRVAVTNFEIWRKNLHCFRYWMSGKCIFRSRLGKENLDCDNYGFWYVLIGAYIYLSTKFLNRILELVRMVFLQLHIEYFTIYQTFGNTEQTHKYHTGTSTSIINSKITHVTRRKFQMPLIHCISLQLFSTYCHYYSWTNSFFIFRQIFIDNIIFSRQFLKDASQYFWLCFIMKTQLTLSVTEL